MSGASRVAWGRTVRPAPSGPGPDRAPWRPRTVAELSGMLLVGRIAGGPHVIAVDGRGGAGKSVLADRLADAVTMRGLVAAVIRTDDVAWHHSFFGWDELLRRNVLEPAGLAQPVQWVPPAWRERGREGAVAVPAGCEVLIVEGSGVARRSLRHLLDAVVWVRSDAAITYERLLARDGDTAANREFIAAWQAEEQPLMARERPWEVADVVVLGTPAEEPRAEQVLVDR